MKFSKNIFSFNFLVLMGIVFIEVIISLYIGYRLNLQIKLNNNYIHAKYFAKLPREHFVTPNDSELHNYFELGAKEMVQDTQNWLPYVAKYAFNKDGLNDRFDYEIEKPTGVFRIITIGDSFTFGHYVNTGENYPEQLEDVLNKDFTCPVTPKIEVINLGVPGYDIQYAVHRYSRVGKKYLPDLVLWLVKADDVRNINELTIGTVRSIIDEASASRRVKEYTNKYGIYYAHIMALEKFTQTYSKESIFEMQRANLRKISDYYKGSLVLFTFKGVDKDIKYFFEDFVKNRTKIWFTDDVEYRKNLVLPDGHPTNEGYRTIVQSLVTYLHTTNLLPCPNHK